MKLVGSQRSRVERYIRWVLGAGFGRMVAKFHLIRNRHKHSVSDFFTPSLYVHLSIYSFLLKLNKMFLLSRTLLDIIAINFVLCLTQTLNMINVCKFQLLVF